MFDGHSSNQGNILQSSSDLDLTKDTRGQEIVEDKIGLLL